MPLASFHHRCPLNPKCPPLPWWDVLVHPVRWMQRLRLAFCPWTTRAWSAWHFFPNWKDLRIFPMDRSNSEIPAKLIPHWHVSGTDPCYSTFLNRGKVHLQNSDQSGRKWMKMNVLERGPIRLYSKGTQEIIKLWFDDCHTSVRNSQWTYTSIHKNNDSMMFFPVY